MNTYSFTYPSQSDCKHTVYITASDWDEAEAKFQAQYGSDVIRFLGVDRAQVAR